LALPAKTDPLVAIHAVPIGWARGSNADVIKFTGKPCHRYSPPMLIGERAKR
jgi:hypothetical protein